MSSALFINGIFNNVLTEILDAQEARGGGGESFPQPFKGHVIRLLKERQPTPESPIRLYVSTTENLSQICYTAEIVRYEDKRQLSERRRQEVGHHLKRYQSGEVDYFAEFDENASKAVNLITIRGLRRLDSLHSSSLLRKVSDGMSLKKRSRAGRME